MLIEFLHLAIFDTINAKVMTKLLTENIFQMDKIRRKEVVEILAAPQC